MSPRAKGQGARAMLREMILSGRFKPGTFLPSVRDLADEIEVSKSAIHNIMVMLQQEGLIQIQPRRKGARVLDFENRRKALSRIFVRPSDYGFFGKLPESPKMLGGLCAAAECRSVDVLLTFSDSLKFIDEIIDLHRTDAIQGVIYMACNDMDLVKPLEKSNIPYVVMREDRRALECVKCVLDFRDIARRAVYHLRTHGHERLGMLHGDTSSYLYAEMVAGFRGALAEEKLAYNPEWMLQIDDLAARETHVNQIAKLLESAHPPTAFFTARDYRAALLYDACDRVGVDIPGGISVISYDDVTWKEGSGRGLTTFSEPAYELGEAAVEMLQAWVSTGERPMNRDVKSVLIERSSVGTI